MATPIPDRRSLTTLQDFVTEVIRGYQAFSVPDGKLVSDPTTYFRIISGSTTLAKGVFTAMLAMFSDILIVSCRSSALRGVMRVSQYGLIGVPDLGGVELQLVDYRDPYWPPHR